MVKNDWGCRDHRTLKSSVPHKWFDKLSRLTEQFLCTDSDGTVFGLTSSLLCIFDIYFVLFPYGSQSSQIIWENFFLKFLKSMIKHRSLQKGSYKISSVHLSICLSVCDTFFPESTQWMVDVLNFLHKDILPYTLKTDKAIFWKIVFVF